MDQDQGTHVPSHWKYVCYYRRTTVFCTGNCPQLKESALTKVLLLPQLIHMEAQRSCLFASLVLL